MLMNKGILAVVPARGGSKGVKLKNIVPLNGIPLVEITGNLIKKLDYIDKAIVSTDHPQIADIAKKAGLEAPFYRPEELSGDVVSDADVLNHALSAIEELDSKTYDIILMLQPTCPLRKPEHVSAAAEKLIRGGYDSVWTVSRTDSKFHPVKQLRFENDRLDYYDANGAKIIARQQLDKLYHRNGAAYAITRDCLVGEKSIKGEKTSAVILNEPLVNIDTEFDFRLAEFFMNRDNRDKARGDFG